MRRILTHESENSNADLPSERTISRKMRVDHVSGGFKLALDGTISNAFTAWGQYIIHDILQTPDVHNGKRVPKHFEGCKCTPLNERNDEFLDFCHQIDFPGGRDPVLKSVPCIFITRSQSQLVRSRNGDVIFREQETAQTNFILMILCLMFF